MNSYHRFAHASLATAVIIAMLGLSACGKKQEDTAQLLPANTMATSTAATTSTASTPANYEPLTADQLYRMVSPISLFPDKLVALVLAGATYPDQVTAANTWLGQSTSEKREAIATLADQQPWDPSVKALTAFPSVLSQMANNLPWTTALGQAYYNDPNDVLNAIQVMRQRAKSSGHLTTGSQMRVSEVVHASSPASYTPDPRASSVYEGPAVVPAPTRTIVIEPAQPDVVYVPSYNPAVVYGAPVALYPGYVYRPWAYAPGAVVSAGILSFGIGITVGATFAHYGWGWHAWGMNWGGPHQGEGDGGWQRPAVVFNHTTYISRSTTVINHFNNTRITNNYNNTVNNTVVRNITQQGAVSTMQAHVFQPLPGTRSAVNAGLMSTPHFTAGDMRPGTQPAHPIAPTSHATAIAMVRMTPSALTHAASVTPHVQSAPQVTTLTSIQHASPGHSTPQNSVGAVHDGASQGQPNPLMTKALQRPAAVVPRVAAAHSNVAKPPVAALAPHTLPGHAVPTHPSEPSSHPAAPKLHPAAQHVSAHRTVVHKHHS